MDYIANVGLISILAYTTKSNLILYSTISSNFAYYAFDQSLNLMATLIFEEYLVFKFAGYKRI